MIAANGGLRRLDSTATCRRDHDRIKTDQCDSLELAGLAHTGEPTPVYVPDAGDEVILDRVRTREGMVVTQRQTRQRPGAHQGNCQVLK